MEYPKFKVCCRCFTFNQAKYITDTMNGFTMQQTTFPFVCTIVDDASTDGEQEVIKQYVEDNFDFSEGSAAFNKETDYAFITYAQHKTNKNCYFAVLYLKENHYSQRKPKMSYLSEWRDICDYEAMCEGDDYWIEPMKIQKQVEFLEEHSDYIMCFTDFNIYYQNNNIMDCSLLKNQPQKFPHKFTMREWIFGKKYVGPMTWMYKTKEVENFPKISTPDGTFVWFAYFLNKGKIHCLLDFTSAVYRYCDSGITHSKDIMSIYRRSIELLKCQEQLLKLYIPNDYDQLSKELRTEWSNQNIHLPFFVKDTYGLSIIKSHFSHLKFINIFLYVCYILFPSVVHYLYNIHLRNKGIICGVL